MGTVAPLSLLEKEANEESTRSALLWQRGQEASSLERLSGRNSSNLAPHSEHTYSYNGISVSCK